MGLIEPLAIAAPLPSGILLLGSSLSLAVPLVGALSIAAIWLCYALARRQRPLRTIRVCEEIDLRPRTSDLRSGILGFS